MRFSDVFAASLVAPLVAAHGGIPGAPKIFGLAPRDIAMLKSRNLVGGHRARNSHSHSSHQLAARQGGVNGRCGPVANGASCAEGYCCSAAGYCGVGTAYCAAPDGLFAYGPANDANAVPTGGSTRSIPRPVLGDQYYGGDGIYSCVVPGTVAITYDDGPYSYTTDVINAFNAEGFKATFFITGKNIGKGAIDDTSLPWPGMIQKMIDGGHQVASHTWSHQDLSAITKEQRYEQMVKNEMAIANIIGKFPTYMRPPYSSCTAESGCAQDMTDLGYVVSYFDLDTDDYNNLTPEKIQTAKDNFNNAIVGSDKTTKDFLAVAHDIHEIVARNLTTTMIATLKAAGYRGVTMGECMGDPAANWYRAASPRVATTSSFTPPPTGSASSSASSVSATGSISVSATTTSTAPSSTATVSSKDGSCGGTLGYTCKGFSGGSCCSQYGWCGATEIYCGTGCNPLYGNCGLASSSSSSTIASSTVASSSASVLSSSSVSSSAVISSSATPSPSSSSAGSSSASSSAIGSSSASSSARVSSSASSSVAASSSVSSSAAVSSSVSSSAARSSTVSSTVQSSSSPVASSTARSSSSSSSPSSSAGVSSSNRVSSSSVASSTPVSSTVRSSSTTIPSSTRASSTVRSSTPVPNSTLATSTVRSSSSASRTSSSTAAATPTKRVSTNGLCGPLYGATCLGSAFGNCCSIAGVCGSTAASCGTLVCNPSYGNCGSNNGAASSTVRSSSSSTRTSSTASPSATLKVSTNGACGAAGSNQTCKGSTFGNCCSQYGWCGSTSTYCGTGCQKGFGNCT